MDIIFESKKPIFKTRIGNFKNLYFDYFKCIRGKKDLITYTRCSKSDWIHIARGPEKFYGLTREKYKICTDILNSGKYPVYTRIFVKGDRKYIEIFKQFMKKQGAEIIYESKR